MDHLFCKQCDVAKRSILDKHMFIDIFSIITELSTAVVITQSPSKFRFFIRKVELIILGNRFLAHYSWFIT